MNTPLISPDIARWVAKQLFLENYPDHGGWFDLAWETTLKGPRPSLESGALSPLPGLGAGATTDPFTQQMARNFAVYAAELIVDSETAKEALVEHLVRSATKHGAARSFIDQLVVRTRHLLGKVSHSTGIRAIRLRRCCHSAHPANAAWNALARANPGRWNIHHRDIGALFGFQVSGDMRRIHQYPQELGKLVGLELRRRMLAPCSDSKYVVSARGWSFLWIACHKDPSGSELVLGVSDVQPSCNEPHGHATQSCKCAVHARRNFVEIQGAFPEQCQKVVESFAEIYRVEARSRKEQRNPEERLKLHQTESGPVMEQLKSWFTEQLDGKRVEPNSGLGQAIGYMLDRWAPLTRFLTPPGAPLDNNVIWWPWCGTPRL